VDVTKQRSRSRPSRAALAALLITFAACDPGWGYTVPAGVAVEEDGLRYKLPGPDSTALRVYGSSFVFDLNVVLDITNTGKSLIEIRPGGFTVQNDKGTTIPLPAPAVCKGLTTAPVRLPTGATCSIEVQLKLPPANPHNYRNLTLSLPSLIREGREFGLRVPLVGTM
jgi:hypothetical protein